MSTYVRCEIPVTPYHILQVFVWKRKRDFNRATGTSKKADACFYNGVQIKHYPVIGEVHFVRGLIGSGMVAHELTHAAHHFARLHGMAKNEEYMCELVQILTINFWSAVQNNKHLRRWINDD